jgi:phage terminase large subunit-like protein
MQAFRGEYSSSDQRREKKKKEKRGPQFATKNLGIWVVKEMTFECFVLP